MRDFNDSRFDKILGEISDDNLVIDTKLSVSDFTSLLYFLIKKFYYAVIVDDYPFEIIDKKSLLEALYYQVKLITMHDLNWDATQEGLCDALNNFLEFNGIILIFRNGESLKKNLPNEFKMLSEIIQDINGQENHKKIKILI